MSATHAVKPVYPREQPVQPVEPRQPHQEALHPVEPQLHHELPAEDRRKACRRMQHLPVLVELRSGVERRRHNLFEGGVDEHIDIEV
ncbi:MAG: hypothetical protein HZB95_08615 [Nitrosomonadales bacterium]|nr:hypothetical protein [Nitrosomonadales bacterium]